MAAMVAAALGVVAWLGLLAVLMRATRTPDVPRTPATGEFGSESPALVDFLTGGFKLCDEAASATVLDLAARRYVTIEEIGPELSLVRLRRDVDVDALNTYERMVFDHVSRLATNDGVVATGALAEGARHLGRWWKAFAKAVRDEARAAGLSEARWTATHRSVLSVGAAVPAVLIGVVFAAFEHGADSDPIGAFLAGTVIAWAVLVFLQERVNDERGTQAGARAAGHWLGVQEHLANGRFADQPAAGVTIWGRGLAYAAALGLADRAVVSLPISTPADDGRAWSDYGGMWHLVHVEYRGRGPWGRFVWGRAPGDAVKTGLKAGMVCASPILVLSILASAILGHPDNPITFAIFVTILVAAVPCGFAAFDSSSPTTVRGQVIRTRAFAQGRNDGYRYWVGIDDGRTDRTRRIHAYGVDEQTFNGLVEGDEIEARAGRWLGWMRDVRVVRPSRQRPCRGNPIPVDEVTD